MKKTRNKTRFSAFLAQIMLMAATAILIGYFMASLVGAFDWARFTFKWERPEGVDQVIYQVDYVDRNGKPGNYEMVITGQDEITDELGFGGVYTIKLIPVVGGLRGDHWVEYTVKPKDRNKDNSIAF